MSFIINLNTLNLNILNANLPHYSSFLSFLLLITVTVAFPIFLMALPYKEKHGEYKIVKERDIVFGISSLGSNPLVSFVLYSPDNFSDIETQINGLRKASFQCELIGITTISNGNDFHSSIEKSGTQCTLKLLVSDTSLEPYQIYIIGQKYTSGRYMCVIDSSISLNDDFLSNIEKEIRKDTYPIIVLGSNVKENSILLKLSNLVSHFLIPQTKVIPNPFPRLIVINNSTVSTGNLTEKDSSILMKLVFSNDIESVKNMGDGSTHSSSKNMRFNLPVAIAYLSMLVRLAKYRPLKFLIVGLIGIGVNEGLLALLHIYYPVLEIISPIAIEVSILSNYLLNAFWTFSDRSTKGGRFSSFSIYEMVKYNIVALGGLVINLGVLLLLSNYGVQYLEANLVGIILGFIVNYIGSEKIVWRYKNKSESS